MTEQETYWFDFDLSGRTELAAGYRNIPVTFLNFSVRTRNALKRHNRAMDIADLLCESESIRNAYGLGVKTLEEINEQLMPLIEGAEISLVIDDSVTIDALQAISPYPPLPESVAGHSLGVLHLPLRAFKALSRVGIETIGELERASANELHSVPNLGGDSLSEIYQRISALRSALNEETAQVDWYQFWDSQGIKLIPQVFEPDRTVHDILAQFPRIIEEIFVEESNERAWYVIKRRFGLDGKPTLTLEELGTAFDLTRERVRQIEEKWIRHFRRLLLEREHVAKPYHIRVEVVSAFQVFSQVIEQAAAAGVPVSTLRALLVVEFEIDESTLSRIFEMSLAICDISRLNVRLSGIESILYSTSTAFPKGMDLIIPIIHRFVTHQAAPASDVDILIEVNKQLQKKDRIQLADLRMVLPLCGTVEMIDPGVYQGKFEYLSARAEQMERILTETGKPLSIAAICREMNYRILNSEGQTLNERNVGNQMVIDDRFSSIGRSGLWTLTRWSTETGTIIEIMKQFLMARNTPATAEEIVAYVQDKRPASDASIKSYLAFDSAFAQVTRGTWGLADWEEVRTAKTWNPEDVALFVEEFFRSQRVRRIEYKVLKQALMNETGYSEARVKGMLNVNPAIQTEAIGYSQRFAVFQPDFQDKLQQSGARFERKNKTLLERIAEDVKTILESSPGKQMGLKELIGILTVKHGKQYKRPYSVLHSYVSRLDFVEKIPIENSNLMMCRLMNTHSEGLQDRAINIRTAALRTNVLRSLEFLTEKDVDVALFLLSKEFEATLKRYVENAILAGELPPLGPKERLKLDGMISKIKNGNILTDDAVLAFLRQSRNDRAHGTMPALEERRIMMSQIGVTAGMYIDYIQFFDDLTFDLGAASS